VHVEYGSSVSGQPPHTACSATCAEMGPRQACVHVRCHVQRALTVRANPTSVVHLTLDGVNGK